MMKRDIKKRSLINMRHLIIIISLLLSTVLFFCVNPLWSGEPDTSVKEKVKAGKDYKEGELLVKFKVDVSEEKKEKVHKKFGSEKIKEFKGLSIDQIKIKEGLSVEEAIELYSTEPDVEYAEPDYIMTTQLTPNDPYFSYLWGLNNANDADIDAPEGWVITTGNSGVVVAVIDTGVDYNHPDLSANIWVNTAEKHGLPGIDDDGNGYIDDIYGIDTYNNDSNPVDDDGHGTHVSGTIGAVGNNGIGVAGVNWDVKIMACKFLNSKGSGSTSGAIGCLEYIRNMKNRGVNVVATNNSWGGGGYSQSLYDAINAQRTQGILFIAAAGNNGRDNDKTAFYPASYYLPNLLSVAATDSSDNKASWSNYGRRSVDVGAPGVSILSTVPNNKYSYYSGTSMATPHVTGLAALIESYDASKDWKALKNLILSGGDNKPSMQGNTITGKRINAFGSLTCVDSPVFSVLKYPSSITPGTSTTLSALSINCASPVSPVTVITDTGATIELKDDGISSDIASGDGIFTATWIMADTTYLTFSSSAGSETINYGVSPLMITTTSLPNGIVGTYYSAPLEATGGVKPYSWSIIGSLPGGLNLNSSTGVISGTPTTPGVFNFTAQVTDVQPTTDTQPLSITIIENKPALPDLVVSSLSAQGSVKAGSTINISDTTANNGTGTAASSTTRFYLSIDSAIGGDTQLGSRTVPSLSAGSSSSGRTVVTIPAGTTKGNYYIIAEADADKKISELNESNNTKAVLIRVR
jgi:hypothetical protein